MKNGASRTRCCSRTPTVFHTGWMARLSEWRPQFTCAACGTAFYCGIKGGDYADAIHESMPNYKSPGDCRVVPTKEAP